MSLWADFLTNKQRLISKWPHYFPVYERHMERFRGRPCRLLEIGVYQGGSLQMWKRYLGPLAEIVGIDIDPRCLFEEPQIEVRTGNQADARFLESLGAFDIVIDDGSHLAADTTAAFNALYPATRGIYLVEDLRGQDSFLNFCRRLVALNDDSAFTRQTQSIHFYDSIVVFEKGDHPPASQDIKTGFPADWSVK